MEYFIKKNENINSGPTWTGIVFFLIKKTNEKTNQKSNKCIYCIN